MFKNKMADDSEIFRFAVLVIYVLRLRRRRNARKTIRPKRFWVREVYRRRQSQGEFNNLVRELRGGDRELYFRYKANNQDLSEGLILVFEHE